MYNTADFWLEVRAGLRYIYTLLCFATTLYNGLSYR